jgi:hypothetical protein
MILKKYWMKTKINLKFLNTVIVTVIPPPEITERDKFFDGGGITLKNFNCHCNSPPTLLGEEFLWRLCVNYYIYEFKYF